ncbi:hypothetical protein E2C01_088398 [Portunus trituberculatus]|uniref:Uncharacterized protein n=1 Tax=Portunus trituberculatus TaxID=210409 RepID=A0A5B7JLS3_PORTR|nr:hypothetical protein [Portunus trituberculatus]
MGALESTIMALSEALASLGRERSVRGWTGRETGQMSGCESGDQGERYHVEIIAVTHWPGLLGHDTTMRRDHESSLVTKPTSRVLFAFRLVSHPITCLFTQPFYRNE